MAIIGIDIGTSGCKVCAFNLSGDIISSASRKYSENRGHGTREIDPDVVREKVFQAISETASACPEPIQAISVTCLGESLVCLDENDHVLCPSMVTGDSRGKEGVEKICKDPGADYIFQTTGLAPSQLYSLPKLIWMRDHTDVLSKTKKIFFYEDYIGYLLTGARRVSYSSAGRSMAVDIHRLKWDEALLASASLTSEYFSTLVPSGTIIGYVKDDIAQNCRLSGRIPVVAGAHDQVCAALGCGFLDASFAEDCIGTCECLALILPETYPKDTLQKLQMPCMLYPLPDCFFTTLEVTTCGALMNWARDTLFKGTRDLCASKGIDFFKYMDERVAGRHTDVLILPQFGSSGHPDLNYHMSGTICGLSLETTEEDLYLALKEGIVYQLKLAYEYAAPLNLNFEKIVMAGGAANSPVSSRLRADIFQKPVYTLVNKEAGTLGCMILSAVAIGAYPDITSAIHEVVQYSDQVLPNPENFAEHMEKYQRFKTLYKNMHHFPG